MLAGPFPGTLLQTPHPARIFTAVYGNFRGLGVSSENRAGFFGIGLNKHVAFNVEQAEERLIQQAAQGERAAQRVLFERYRDVAYRVAVRITGRNADAMDVVQDSFVKAFDKLDSYEGTAEFKTWLLRIVSNRALDLLRARKVRLALSLDQPDSDGQKRIVAVEHDETSPAAGIERQELVDRIQAAVEKLPVEQKTVFAMYASDEMTYGQIAEVLGIPLGTVMSRLYHARRKLHTLLADLDPSQREGSK